MKTHNPSQRQYELHLTAPVESALKIPEGFHETLIVNKDRRGNVIQTYVLHTCRLASKSEIPWYLEGSYVRFKVEQKILKAFPKDKKVELNENYFAEGPRCQGIEIHIRTQTDYLDMIPSTVDDVQHQTVFLSGNDPLTIEEALVLVEKYGRDSSKVYLEAVLYDSNPTMDQDWEVACH